jgi:SAM-dependent methyltransferase
VVEVEEYARIAAAEDEHWWYRNTRALVGDFLPPPFDTTRGLRVLDAGCGPGGNGAWLARLGTVIGVDRSPDALRFVRDRRTETIPVRADVTALPIASATVDVVVAITVLYAVADDRAAVRELARVLVPGGVMVLLEPAFPSLRRAHDATGHGRRRYRRGRLRELVESAGLDVRRASYAYSFLAPPAAALAAGAHVKPAPAAARSAGSAPSDVERRSLDRVFAPLASLERRLLHHLDLPVGTSVVLAATAPS